MKQHEEETGTTYEHAQPARNDEESLAEVDEEVESDEETSQQTSLRPRSLYPNFKRLWLVLACLFLLLAIFSLWRGFMNAAFVTATLGILAWFLHVRSQMHLEE